jgi:hypothetical protein
VPDHEVRGECPYQIVLNHKCCIDVDQYQHVFGLYLERPHDKLVAHRWLRGGRFRYSDMKEAAAVADAYVI